MNNTIFDIDRNRHTITVTTKYEAPIEQVWAAWTQSDILDQWWAPHPWKVETKEMNFVPNGRWLYAMVSPEGEKIWSLLEYIEISANHSFVAKDAFCDESGIISYNVHPGSKWHNILEYSQGWTTVTNTISFESADAMDDILNMGFREGYQMGLNNLENYLSKHSTK